MAGVPSNTVTLPVTTSRSLAVHLEYVGGPVQGAALNEDLSLNSAANPAPPAAV